MLEKLALSDNEEVRKNAIAAIDASAAARTTRTLFAAMPAMAAIPSASQSLTRQIYDMKGNSSQFRLPGSLVRIEGQGPNGDAAVNEAYDHSGKVYEFFKTVFGRNSIDSKGMTLISSVHFGQGYNNAFWNGEQMVYGDGDKIIFDRFTKSLDVVGHELTHGITSFTSNLEYLDQPGALNEHFSDVMGVLLQHWSENKTVDKADWRIGDEIMVAPKAKCLRTMTGDKAYEDDPYLGTDPQPKHMKDIYKGMDDNGGVHINSGIPNHAFYLTAMEIGGNAWEKAGTIWFETFTKRLHSTSDFDDAASITFEVAGQLFGHGRTEQKAVANAWEKVGLKVPSLV